MILLLYNFYHQFAIGSILHWSCFDLSPLTLDMVSMLCMWPWSFSKNDTDLCCVRILNAIAKLDSLLENLVCFGSSSLAILSLGGFDTSWAPFHYIAYTGLLLDGCSVQSNQFPIFSSPCPSPRLWSSLANCMWPRVDSYQATETMYSLRFWALRSPISETSWCLCGSLHILDWC